MGIPRSNNKICSHHIQLMAVRDTTIQCHLQVFHPFRLGLTRSMCCIYLRTTFDMCTIYMWRVFTVCQPAA